MKAHLTWVVIESLTTYADLEALCRVNAIGYGPSRRSRAADQIDAIGLADLSATCLIRLDSFAGNGSKKRMANNGATS